MNNAVKKTLITILIATMLISPLIVSQSHAAETNPPIYNLAGTWQLTIHWESPIYLSMTITSFNQISGAFIGKGFDKSDPSMTFMITNGIETGTSVSFTLTYNGGESPSGYYATGSLTSNSFMSGTAAYFYGVEQSGSLPWDAIKFSNPNVILDFPPGSNVKVVVTESSSNGPYPPLQGIIGDYFTITVTGTFSGQVKIGIHYPSGTPTYIAQIDLLLGDVNHDGKVNLLDIALILKAMFTDRGDKRFNPACDLNNDGKVNLQDLAIAFQNFGKTPQWADLTNTHIDTTTNFAYATTDIFSGFGVH